MDSAVNHYISVDCVVFGFDDPELKVLLVDVLKSNEGTDYSVVRHELKLPGSIIQDGENLSAAAHRTLNELTGLNNIYLHQLYVFSDPDRISKPEDLNWVGKTYGVKINRIVTVAYYALVNLNKCVLFHTLKSKARWHSVLDIWSLAFDHKSILLKALEVLRQKLLNETIAFDLLPKRFTIPQLQYLYEAILGKEIDTRNFRRKVLNFPCIKPLDEKEKGVDHKPARLYIFDRIMYEKDLKLKMDYNLNFIRITD